MALSLTLGTGRTETFKTQKKIMIRIIQNPNFQNWFSLIRGETLLEQIKGKANAVKLAKKLSRNGEISEENCSKN
jgi:hypothetical protein